MDFNKHVFHIFSENAYERKREVTELSKPKQNKIEVVGVLRSQGSHIFWKCLWTEREVTESELSKPNKNKIEVKGGSQITRRWISY